MKQPRDPHSTGFASSLPWEAMDWRWAMRINSAVSCVFLAAAAPFFRVQENQARAKDVGSCSGEVSQVVASVRWTALDKPFTNSFEQRTKAAGTVGISHQHPHLDWQERCAACQGCVDVQNGTLSLPHALAGQPYPQRFVFLNQRKWTCQKDPKSDKDMAMDQYLLIPFLVGYSHPFTSYFGVHYMDPLAFNFHLLSFLQALRLCDFLRRLGRFFFHAS